MRALRWVWRGRVAALMRCGSVMAVAVAVEEGVGEVGIAAWRWRWRVAFGELEGEDGMG